MGREVVSITAGSDGWTLVHKGRRIGPYPTEKQALSVAQIWAEGARRQGIILEFVHDGESPEQQLVEARNDGRTTDESSRV